MPRLYAPNETHSIDWNHVPFVEGAAAVPHGTDISFFTAAHYTVDNSKHATNLLDTLTVAQLKGICDYLQVVYTDENTKSELVRLIEGFASTALLGSVTAVSAEGDEEGDTKITITGDGAYKYKTAASTAPAPLYLDDVSDWADISSLDQFAPVTGHDKITVAEVDEAGLVLGLGSDDITVNPGGE